MNTKTITIINGNPDPDNTDFEVLFEKAVTNLRSQAEKVNTFILRNLQIISCTGCWGCWVKTPGECTIPDDTIEIRDKAINSDLLIWATPLTMGFVSAKTKLVMDKMLPLLMPYVELVNNECHHEKRYDKYPGIGFIYHPEEDTDKDDITILKDIVHRFTLNFKSTVKYFQSIEQPIKIQS